MSLTTEIQRLEHACDIVLYGADPDHCRRCRCISNGHHDGEWMEISSVSGRRFGPFCATCGVNLEGDA